MDWEVEKNILEYCYKGIEYGDFERSRQKGDNTCTNLGIFILLFQCP